MKRSKSFLAQSVFLLMCSVAVAQTPDRPSSTSESPRIRQIADITVLGDSGVVILLVDENGVVNQKLRLAGPYVKLFSSPGNASLLVI